MAGLVPAIHVLGTARNKDVDARHKAGHDAERFEAYSARVAAFVNFFSTRSRLSFDR
jgi:hypothetical protein